MDDKFIFSTVIFLDDIFRQEFLSGRKFVYSLIEEPLKYALNINSLDLGAYPSYRGLKSNFNEKLFISLNKEKWYENYNYISDEAWEYLKDHFDKFALIIGYEMPKWLNLRLKNEDIKFINIRLSPIRFARDLMFVVETNLPKKKTLEWSVSNQQLKFEAGLVKSKIRHDQKGLKIQNGLIYLAQTHDDASIISTNNKFLKIQDFEKNIKDISLLGKVYYKPHPYSLVNQKYELNIFKDILGYKPNIIKDNIYNLLAADNNLNFLGISSGALQEAEFFDKKSFTLYKPICEFKSNDVYHCTANDFISFNFWLEVLGIEDREKIHIKKMDDSMMRHLHNAWWGYAGYVQNESNFYNTFLKINRPKNRFSRWIRKLI